MTPKEFYEAMGAENVERIAKKAGTTLSYYREIMYGRRRPSLEMAEAIAKASDGHLSVWDLLNTVSRPKRSRRRA